MQPRGLPLPPGYMFTVFLHLIHAMLGTNETCLTPCNGAMLLTKRTHLIDLYHAAHAHPPSDGMFVLLWFISTYDKLLLSILFHTRSILLFFVPLLKSTHPLCSTFHSFFCSINFTPLGFQLPLATHSFVP